MEGARFSPLANPLHNLDDAMEELEKLSIRTSQGEFVKMEDVKRLMAEKREAASIEKEVEKEKPKDMNGAKQAILKDPDIMKNFPPPRREPGRSIPSQDPHPASRP